MLPRIIAINSSARQAGKSTVASALVGGYGYWPAKLAGGIYAMWDALCDYVELPASIKKDSITTLKETPLAQVGGASFRTFAEGPGHYCRTALGRSFWSDVARAKFLPMLDRGERLVVDDLRMQNEADMLLNLGAVIVKVERPLSNGGLAPTLPSELDSPVRTFDHVFVNDGTIEQLRMKVHSWLVEPVR